MIETDTIHTSDVGLRMSVTADTGSSYTILERQVGAAHSFRALRHDGLEVLLKQLEGSHDQQMAAMEQERHVLPACEQGNCNVLPHLELFEDADRANCWVTYPLLECDLSVAISKITTHPGLDGPQRVRAALALWTQAALAVMRLHRRGVYHHSVHPSSLLCTPLPEQREAATGVEHRVLLSGFETARFARSSERRDVVAAAAAQAAEHDAYMSPEQAEAQEVEAAADDSAVGTAAWGPAVDWWCLGVLLYELLHGCGSWAQLLCQRPSTDSSPYINADIRAGLARYSAGGGSIIYPTDSIADGVARTIMAALLQPNPGMRGSIYNTLLYLPGEVLDAISEAVPELAREIYAIKVLKLRDSKLMLGSSRSVRVRRSSDLYASNTPHTPQQQQYHEQPPRSGSQTPPSPGQQQLQQGRQHSGSQRFASVLLQQQQQQQQQQEEGHDRRRSASCDARSSGPARGACYPGRTEPSSSRASPVNGRSEETFAYVRMQQRSSSMSSGGETAAESKTASSTWYRDDDLTVVNVEAALVLAALRECDVLSAEDRVPSGVPSKGFLSKSGAMLRHASNRMLTSLQNKLTPSRRATASG